MFNFDRISFLNLFAWCLQQFEAGAEVVGRVGVLV